MSVKILLVDDHSLVNEGISRIINSDKNYIVVARLTNGHDAIEYVKKNDVHIVIMDINMPGIDGITATREIKKILPGIKVIGLSMLGDYGTIHKMLENGADGYLLKNTSGDELFAALTQVLDGKTFLNAELQQLLMKGLREQKNIPQLTKKEKEVLNLISAGLTNKEIATKMNLGEETIKSHRKNIMNKFDIHNTAELVRFAIDHQLI
jgi:DNA-binding NarL/FixJ family response regulator